MRDRGKIVSGILTKNVGTSNFKEEGVIADVNFSIETDCFGSLGTTSTNKRGRNTQ